MPSLIGSSRYTIDSQILRKAAQALGWETLRLDGNRIPDWFQPQDDEIAFFYTAPHAFDVARQLGRELVGCNPDWTVSLPADFLLRELYQTTLEQAAQIIEPQFVKHSVSKAFPAKVYDVASLIDATKTIPADSIIHVGEPVEWTHEYRCFVANNTVQTASPYVCEGQVIVDYDSVPLAAQSRMDQAIDFADKVLRHPDVSTPPAFVLDVGLIRDRGWAVVECNECWAAGIYACDPVRVLRTLACSSVRHAQPQWDFRRHYSKACGIHC